MSVIRSTGSSGAFDNSGSGDTESLVSGAAVAVVYSVGIAFGGHHPNLLLYFCKWSNSVSIPNCSAFGGAVVLGVGCPWAWGSTFCGWF